jgi:hypothetical protein
MSTKKLGTRGPWLWVGLFLALAAGVSIAGTARKVSARAPAAAETAAPAPVRAAPAAPAGSEGRGAPAGGVRADRDVCAQQLD